MHRPIGIVLALSLAVPLSASALTLVSQDRSVHADAYLAPSFGTPIVVSETKVSPDFGPFVETVNAAAGFAGAGGGQTSTITPLSDLSLQVDASGGGAANAFDMFGDNQFGLASVSSHFEITFAVDAAVPYDLSARIFGTTLTDPFQASPFREWSARVELLDGGGGALAQLVGSSAPGDPPAYVDEAQLFSGVLAPGMYTLRAIADGKAWGDQYFPDYAYSQVSFALDLSIVPEPGPAGLLLFGLAFVAVRRRAS